MTRKSGWLEPGEVPCEGCRGSGRNRAGSDACPACRGFGSAPPDPATPPAVPGTICAACGNPGRDSDPVLATVPHPIHRSHAIEQQAAHRDALARLGRGAR